MTEKLLGYDRWKTTPEDEEDTPVSSECPVHGDGDQEFECGGIGEHFCSLAEREINGCKQIPSGPCSCPTDQDLEEAEGERRFKASQED